MFTGILLIKLGISLSLFCFGLSEFIRPNLKLIPSDIQQLIPFDPRIEIKIQAIINILIAGFLLSGFYSLQVVWIAFIWQILLLPFVLYDNWRMGIKDVCLTFCLGALIFLLS